MKNLLVAVAVVAFLVSPVGCGRGASNDNPPAPSTAPPQVTTPTPLRAEPGSAGDARKTASRADAADWRRRLVAEGVFAEADVDGAMREIALIAGGDRADLYTQAENALKLEFALHPQRFTEPMAPLAAVRFPKRTFLFALQTLIAPCTNARLRVGVRGYFVGTTPDVRRDVATPARYGVYAFQNSTAHLLDMAASATEPYALPRPRERGWTNFVMPGAFDLSVGTAPESGSPVRPGFRVNGLVEQTEVVIVSASQRLHAAPWEMLLQNLARPLDVLTADEGPPTRELDIGPFPEERIAEVLAALQVGNARCVRRDSSLHCSVMSGDRAFAQALFAQVVKDVPTELRCVGNPPP